MPDIAVTPEQLQSVASRLNAGAANIESILSQLASQVAPLHVAESQRSSRGIQEALHGETEQGIASPFTR